MEKPKAGEPSQWAKIAYPAGAHVWVHSSYVDAQQDGKAEASSTSAPGPGENYSIVGVIEHGAPVKEISTKGNWIEIEAPPRRSRLSPRGICSRAPSAATVPPIVSSRRRSRPRHDHYRPDRRQLRHDHRRDARDRAPNPATEPTPVPVPDAANAAPRPR